MVQQGASVEGWIVYRIPASLSREEMQIHWESGISRPERNDLGQRRGGTWYKVLVVVGSEQWFAQSFVGPKYEVGTSR